MTTVTVGSALPEFNVATTAGAALSPATMRGQYWVIYFYPKDNTPGCTQEGQDFRDLHSEFAALGAEIVGISRDSLKSHQGFKAKHGFNFELASDADETVCQLFEVIKTKNLYGKAVLGIERSTFLIDPDGYVRAAWRKVNVKNHAATVLATLCQCVAARPASA